MGDGMTGQFTQGYHDTQQTENIQQWTGDGAELEYKSSVEATDVKLVECWESGSWAEKTETTEWSHDNPASDTITVTFVDGNEPSAAVAAVDVLTFDTKANTVAGDFVTVSSAGGDTYAVWFRTVAAVAAQDTFTFETKANSDDGDFITFQNAAGATFACALDLTGASAEPTSDFWTAIDADDKVQCDISGTTTAADVAAAVEASIATITNLADITTDDTAADGTLTITCDNGGATDDPASYTAASVAADDSDITWAEDTAGVTATAAPTSSVYTALDSAVKAMADISSETTAADVAAVAVTSFEGISGFTDDFTLTDNADGTVDFTCDTAGDTDDPEDYAAASETDGTSSITWAEDTEGKTYTLRVTFYQPSSTLNDGLASGL